MATTEAHLEVADVLASMRGVVAVVLGGSRALGMASETSDWDLGVYYRGQLELGVLSKLGTVHPPGSWGRIMNGGAWLELRGAKIDVLLRDLDVVEHWSERARDGVFEIDALLGYTAGVPTYSLLAERAVALPLHGVLPSVAGFPARLSERAPARWHFNAQFSLDYARAHAKRGDRIGVLGQAAKAVIEAAHARLCAQKRWVLNEKGIVAAAGLDHLQQHFAASLSTDQDLHHSVEELRAALAVTV